MGSFSAGDKVRRKPMSVPVAGADGDDGAIVETIIGCHGIIKTVAQETTSTPVEKEKSLMYQVLWDNGTLSYLGADMLEAVK